MKNVLVVFGGRSAEHDVSIVTALVAVIPALEASGKYRVMPFYIAPDGGWYAHYKLKDIKTFQGSDFAGFLKKISPAKLFVKDGFYVTLSADPTFIGKQKGVTQQIDVAFPSMHGTYGEDGSLMGLLRMAGVPFVGCDIFASAVAMDKVLTKQVTESAGLPSVKYEWFNRRDWDTDEQGVKKRLGALKLPLFVKPAHLGSSIAITKVEKADQLENAIEVALHYDDKVIVEEGVENLIEVTVPVMGNEEIKTGLVERALNKEELFSFEDKYMHGGKKTGEKSAYSELPAKIDKALIQQSQDLAKAAYKAIGAEGIARIDLLIDGRTNKIYLNEINTLPGSLYHHNWKVAGVSNVELVDKLIELAEERSQRQAQTSYNFESRILGQFE